MAQRPAPFAAATVLLSLFLSVSPLAQAATAPAAGPARAAAPAKASAPSAKAPSSSVGSVPLNTTGPNINDLTKCQNCPGWPQASATILNGTCTPVCTGVCCVYSWAISVTVSSAPVTGSGCVVGCEPAAEPSGVPGVHPSTLLLASTLAGVVLGALALV